MTRQVSDAILIEARTHAGREVFVIIVNDFAAGTARQLSREMSERDLRAALRVWFNDAAIDDKIARAREVAMAPASFHAGSNKMDRPEPGER